MSKIRRGMPPKEDPGGALVGSTSGRSCPGAPASFRLQSRPSLTMADVYVAVLAAGADSILAMQVVELMAQEALGEAGSRARERRMTAHSKGTDPAVFNDPEATLRALAAQRLLAVVRSRRAIAALAAQGMPQTQIARLAGVSQAHISRTLSLLADSPNLLAETPQEIGWRHAAGEITTGVMMARLKAWPYTYGLEHPDDYEPGSWDGITDLVVDGFLTDQQFRTLFAAAGPKATDVRS